MSRFRLDPAASEYRSEPAKRRVVLSGPFVTGPLPFHPYLDHLPPGYRLFFALWRQQQMKQTVWTKANRHVWQLAGLATPGAQRNALRQLEKLPFVTVKRKRGAFPLVRILASVKGNGVDRSPPP